MGASWAPTVGLPRDTLANWKQAVGQSCLPTPEVPSLPLWLLPSRKLHVSQLPFLSQDPQRELSSLEAGAGLSLPADASLYGWKMGLGDSTGAPTCLSVPLPGGLWQAVPAAWGRALLSVAPLQPRFALSSLNP